MQEAAHEIGILMATAWYRLGELRDHCPSVLAMFNSIDNLGAFVCSGWVLRMEDVRMNEHLPSRYTVQDSGLRDPGTIPAHYGGTDLPVIGYSYAHDVLNFLVKVWIRLALVEEWTLRVEVMKWVKRYYPAKRWMEELMVCQSGFMQWARRQPNIGRGRLTLEALLQGGD